MNIADADLDGLVTEGDPEKDFNGLYEIGHGSFGSVYYVSCVPFFVIKGCSNVTYASNGGGRGSTNV